MNPEQPETPLATILAETEAANPAEEAEPAETSAELGEKPQAKATEAAPGEDDLSAYPYAATPTGEDAEEAEVTVDEETGEIQGLEPPGEDEDVAAFIARKEKGVRKLVHQYRQKLQEAENLLSSPTAQILAYAQSRLGDNPKPEDVKAVWNEIRQATEAAYGISLDDPTPAASKTREPYEEDAYGNVVIDGVSFDKSQAQVLQKLIAQGVEMGVSQLKRELLPALKFVESQQAQAELHKTARQVLPLLRQTYRDFVTEEKLLEAMRAKPGYDPVDAFKAYYADELALNAYKAGATRAAKEKEAAPRNLLREENLGTLDEMKREWDEPVPLTEILRRLPVR